MWVKLKIVQKGKMGRNSLNLISTKKKGKRDGHLVRSGKLGEWGKRKAVV